MEQARLNRGSVSDELSSSLKGWYTTTKENIDLDNCSSGSWTFYLLVFLVGTCEMLLSLCIFFGA